MIVHPAETPYLATDLPTEYVLQAIPSHTHPWHVPHSWHGRSLTLPSSIVPCIPPPPLNSYWTAFYLSERKPFEDARTHTGVTAHRQTHQVNVGLVSRVYEPCVWWLRTRPAWLLSEPDGTDFLNVRHSPFLAVFKFLWICLFSEWSTWLNNWA